MNYAQTKITVFGDIFHNLTGHYVFWQLSLFNYLEVLLIVSRKCHFNHEQLFHIIYEGKIDIDNVNL